MEQERAHPKGSELLTLKDAADRIGVHERTLARWVKEGRVPALRYARTVRVDWSAVVKAGLFPVEQPETE